MAECYSINQYEQAAHLLPIRFQRIALHLPDWQKEQAEEQPSARPGISRAIRMQAEERI